MKIMHIAPYYHPFRGGVESYIKNLSEAMVRQGHEIEVLCSNVPRGKAVETINGVKVRRFPCWFRISYLPIIPTVKWALLRSRADVYHLHIAPPLLPEVGLMFAKLKRKPVVLTYHNDVIAEGLLGLLAGMYNRTLLKVLLGGVDRIIVHTRKYLKSSPYLSRYGKKAEIIPSGVDIKRFNTKDKKLAKGWLGLEGKTILFVGSLNPKHMYKGIHLLIKAMPGIRKEFPDARLVIVGEGELRKEYEALAEGLDCVRFEGFVEDNALPSYYKAANVLALPSTNTQEGWGLAPIEALACGTPVVVSDRAGVSEVINESVGAIAKTGDVGDLSAKITEVLTKAYDPEKLHTFAERFSWDKIAKDTLKVYESAKQ